MSVIAGKRFVGLKRHVGSGVPPEPSSEDASHVKEARPAAESVSRRRITSQLTLLRKLGDG